MKKTDLFLQAQFDYALDVEQPNLVQPAFDDLISYAKSISFVEPPQEQARKDWIALFAGSSVHIGFSKFREISQTLNVAQNLEEARREIDASPFLADLKTYSQAQFDRKGLSLNFAPDEYLKVTDIPFTKEVDPELFKNRLLEITGHKSSNAKYLFKKSKSEFFMMSLHLRPQFCIGHGPLKSLFSLSTLAHEIGHTTTPRELDLEKLFVEHPSSIEGNFEFSNEDDSYQYEYFFMENALELTKELRLGDELDLKSRLVRRKAVQNNLHVLKNRMNYYFFSGQPLNEISEIFLEMMRQIYPAYQPKSEFEWLNYATLDQPLSRIGYLRAYPKTFYADPA